MLFYTGKTRSARVILKGVNQTMRDKRAHLRAMKALADSARKALQEGGLDEFGRILHEGWLLKRGLHKGISDGRIDRAYAGAMKAGALGGKILGAGGGGFLLLYAPPERQAAVRAALRGWREIRFEFEPEGSKIIYVDR